MNKDCLKLENQLCFPLYACAREVVKKYKPFLDEIGLTYTQYIVMIVLWEKEGINVKSLGQSLYLDSGTLTPLLKKLEADGLVTRTRSAEDERNLIVNITPKGEQLREKAMGIPAQIGGCIKLSGDDAQTLHRLLNQMLEQL